MKFLAKVCSNRLIRIRYKKTYWTRNLWSSKTMYTANTINELKYRHCDARIMWNNLILYLQLYRSFWMVRASCCGQITNLYKPYWLNRPKNHSVDVCQTILIATALTKLFMLEFLEYPININLPGKYYAFSQFTFIILMPFMFRLPLWLAHSLTLLSPSPHYFAVIWNNTNGNFATQKFLVVVIIMDVKAF